MVTAATLFSAVSAFGSERLDRGVIALNQGDGKVWISWRLLPDDAKDAAFDVFASTAGGQPKKINPSPITGGTFFQQSDAKLDGATTYSVRPSQGKAAEGGFTLPANAPALPYLNVPLKTPAGYTPGDASPGDLDGDGQLDLVIHMVGPAAKDNSQKGVTSEPILQGYKLDGTLLWTVNLGKNIREGAHYTQFMVYDFNGDGRAEVICKTADGTTDGAGKVIGDKSASFANETGYILKGPEFLTVFDGKTGAAIDTIPYQPGRGGPGVDGSDVSGDEIKKIWGDGYGNRGDRFLAGVADLDGKGKPSAIMCRGYYTRSFLWAVDFDGQKLKPRWLFDSENPAQTRNNKITSPSTWDASKITHGSKDNPKPYSGAGFHSLSIADVDGDGKDEIIYGSMTVNSDGTGRYATGWGHGDAEHVGDLDPTRPGLEVFGIQERFDDAGAHMHDANTGEPLWKKPSVKAATEGGDKGEGPARGVCFDVDPRFPGNESWAVGAGMEGLWDAKGNKIGDVHPSSCNFAVWWDGDLLRELLDKNHVDKWNWETQKTDRLLTADGAASNNGTKSTPMLSGDILGDWREEVVLRAEDNQSLRIYSTTIPTEHRVTTLLADPQYRYALAWQNVAYNQPPHPSFRIGPDMKDEKPAAGTGR